MALSGPQSKQIYEALLSAYGTRASLERMVYFQLDENLNRIAGNGDLEDTVFWLIKWAESKGSLAKLVQKAHEYNEGNEKLKEVAGLIDSWLKPAEAAPAKKTPKTTQQAISTPSEKPRQPFEPEMVLIPAGYFLMGSDPIKDTLAYDEEFPQHSFYLPDYYIGKTPVTNYQYFVFMRGAGHKPPEHWEDGALPRDKANHPVVYVTWYDAIAYCEWLSKTTGRAYRLPTEAEWEKAARGTDGRIYSWGDNAPTDMLCNFNGNVKGTTPVGKYPAGANELFDMAGNVWEWTSSLAKFGYPYNAEDGREDMKANGLRMLRGGSFAYFDYNVRCASRAHDWPTLRFEDNGFRVVVGSPGF